LDTLAKFTLAVINTKGRVGDEALAEFLEAGYSQQNALDVVLGVSLASLCNYANNLANTPINPELQPEIIGLRFFKSSFKRFYAILKLT